jgi:integrase
VVDNGVGQGFDFVFPKLRADGTRNARKGDRNNLTLIMPEFLDDGFPIGNHFRRYFNDVGPQTGDPVPWVFQTVSQKGIKPWSGNQMTNQGVNQKIRTALVAIGWSTEEAKTISSHSFRKTVGAALMVEGTDVHRSAQIFGHKHAATTVNHYSRPTQKQKRQLLAVTGNKAVSG